MPRLAPRPANVDMRFVRPSIKRGDYYIVRDATTGEMNYVFPRRPDDWNFVALPATPAAMGSVALPNEAQVQQAMTLFSRIRTATVREAFDAAAQVAQEAQASQSGAATPGAVTEGTSAILNRPGLLVGLAVGALATLGLGYYLLKKGR